MTDIHGDSWEERMALRASNHRPPEPPRPYHLFEDHPEGPTRCCFDWRWFGPTAGWVEAMTCTRVGYGRGCDHKHHDGEIYLAAG